MFTLLLCHVLQEKKTQKSREARHENRRLQVTIADSQYLDLFKFNQLG